MPSQPGSVSPPMVLTPVALHDVLVRVADSMIATTKELGVPVTVTGIVGSIPGANNGMHWSVSLHDPDGADKIVLMDVRHSVLERHGVADGDRVTAIGKVVARLWQGKVEFRVDVAAFDMRERLEKTDARKADLSTVLMLKRIGRAARRFPEQLPVRIAVIHSQSAQANVAQDFLRALGPIDRSVQISQTPVAITSSGAVARAISAANADIIVVIRGGGDSAQFDAFDHEDVLSALGRSKAYCLLGLGHSGNSTLADLFADHSADTPSAAGAFLREQLHRASVIQEAGRGQGRANVSLQAALQLYRQVVGDDALKARLFWVGNAALIAFLIGKLV